MTPQARDRVIRSLRTIFILVLIFVIFMTLWPRPPETPPTVYTKLGQCLGFGALTFVALLAFPQAKALVLGEILAFIAAVIEAAQALPMLGRDSNIFDWLAETAVIAIVLVWSRAPRGDDKSR